MTLPPAALPVAPFDEVSVLAYRRAGLWAGRSLPAELLAAARRHGGRTALVSEGVAWSYDELFDTASRFAAGLLGSGVVRPGEPVVFQMGNVAETVVAYLGCLFAAAPPVCTLPQHGTREIGLLAAHVGARTLIAQADFRDGRLRKQAEQLLADGAVSDVVVCRGEALGDTPSYSRLVAEQVREPLPYLDVDLARPAVFQLSGGTTGLPKVAPRLHEEYAYNARAWAAAMEMDEHSRVLYPLPLMHNAGISLALQPAILTGATLVLAPSADVDTLLDLIGEHRPDVLPLVPPALAVRLLESPRAQAADLSCLRDFVVGGQRLPVEVAERLRDELGIRIRQMFGMAEGMFLVTPAGADEDVRHHTVGAPISAADEIRILDPVSESEVPDGEVGEFAARGPYTIRGYYRAEEHNKTAFTPDGFYRTGDLARRHVSAKGVSYSIDGRIKDVINRGVEKIFAEEVEEIIVQHPDVVTAALVAMPDPVLGERACAYLVLEDGAEPLTVQTLGAHLLSRGLAKYKLPERVEVVPALPLTNVGKVAKNRLREDVQAKLAEGSAR
ncbi:AMP-binding protein [Amycolatopsis sp. Poz14]|uniref:AMP-binding protein n=1 Tax=Amycolatopsis sp. Poz14 TaxID=1447705 RepID=UPI001EE962F8|nr:AMP-binding protein [Amycolatopsis sp. Poz14]